MAIYHLSAKIIGRSSGRSAVGAAAYRSGEKLINERDGLIHDYTKKGGVVHREILLPENAPAKYINREALWNAVERSEKNSNAQTAREIEVALPVEFDREEQLKVLRDYIKENFVAHGMCADFAIHDKNDGNPHAHIMLTMRAIDKNGDWEPKSKKEYILDRNGNRIYDAKKRQYKCRKVENTNWNDPENINIWREQWGTACNRELERKGLEQRIDHRSLQEQGIEREPTIHRGMFATLIERRGEVSDRGQINEGIRARNAEYQEAVKEVKRLTSLVNTGPELANRGRPAPIGAGISKDPKPNEHNEYTENVNNMAMGLGMSVIQDVADKLAAGAERAAVRDIAGRMSELRNRYQSLEKQITELTAIDAARRKQVRTLESRKEGIEERIFNLELSEARLAQLRQERAGLGLFAGKEKKRLDGLIESAERDRESIVHQLQRDYQVKPEQAYNEIAGCDWSIRELSNQGTNGTEIKSLRQQQYEVGLEYKTQRAISETHPQKDEINELVKAKIPISKDVGDRMARARTESELNNKLTISDYRKIIERVEPDMARQINEKLIESKEHTKLMESDLER